MRLTKVTRHADRHDLAEVAVDIVLEGDFAASYLVGDNRTVVPTDTMKNTVYAVAANHPLDAIEAFALALVEHFLTRHTQVSAATVSIEQAAWRRITGTDGTAPPCLRGGRHGAADLSRAGRPRPARGRGGRVAGLTVVKTTDSAFRDFVRDEFTTLADSDDRIFGTAIEARWRYRPPRGPPRLERRLVGGLPAMVDVFAGH